MKKGTLLVLAALALAVLLLLTKTRLRSVASFKSRYKSTIPAKTRYVRKARAVLGHFPTDMDYTYTFTVSELDVDYTYTFTFQDGFYY